MWLTSDASWIWPSDPGRDSTTTVGEMRALRVRAPIGQTGPVKSVAIAVGRSVALTAIALATTVVLALVLVAFTPGIGLGLVFLIPPAVMAERRFTNVIRRMAGRWCDVTIDTPYKEAPAPPVRRPDGWYEQDNSLHKHAWWPRMSARIDWVFSDRATGKDVAFLLLHPLVGTVIVGLPLGLLVATVWIAATTGWAAWLPGLLFLGACVVAPMLVRAYGLWCRAFLGPVAPARQARIDARKRWIGERLVAVVRLLALAGLGLLAALAGVVQLVAVILPGIGFVFGVIPAVTELRRVAELRRRLAGAWSGVPIETPYRIEGPLEREPDGRYRVGKQLFKTEGWARWSERQNRLTKESATWRDFAWALAEPATGVALALVPVGLLVIAWVGLIIPAIVWLAGASSRPLFGDLTIGSAIASLVIGAVAIVFAVASPPTLLRWHGRWTALLLAPTEKARLARRVSQLTEARQEAIEDQAAEVRRIERDLHDGAQARLIAVGLALDAAERLVDSDPEAAKKLVTQARDASATALVELRNLVRGIHPPVLSERGLGDAVRALALDTPLPVDLTVDIPGRASDPIESAAYFAISEALANAVKHAGASRITVDIGWAGGVLRMSVRDDGRGGADPARGTGLAGLSRRVAAFDGTVSLDSPLGGPTEVRMELPCVLSSAKTSLF
jgi:signal transduction histidine kinase